MTDRPLEEPAVLKRSGRLAGKVAFITGAARGQGRSHAVRFAIEGADVIGVDLCAPLDTVAYPAATLDDLGETERMVRTRNGRIVTAQADVRDATALAAAVDAGVGELGRLDVVCANAGIFNFFPDDSDELPERMWQELIDIDLTGVGTRVRSPCPT